MHAAPTLVALFLLAAQLTSAPAFAQTPSTSTAPPTLGEVVLLANDDGHAGDAALKQALLDPDPRVRRMAARVIGVANHRELLAYLIGALSREQDSETGAELVRAALYLRGEADRTIVARHVMRLGAPTILAHAEWLARTDPARFIEGLAGWSQPTVAAQLADLVHLAAMQHPTRRNDLFAAWSAAAPDREWARLLDIAYVSRQIQSRDTFFIAALNSPRAAVREETVWHLVAELNQKSPVPDEILDAAVSPDAPAGSEWEQFGRELIARRHRKARTPDRAALVAAEGERRRARWDLDRFGELTDDERRALFPDGVPRRDFAAPQLTTVWRAATTRTMDLGAPGVLAALVRAVDCRPGKQGIGFAQVWFHPDGRPRRIVVDPGSGSAACLKALSAAARLTFAGPDETASEAPTNVALPYHAAFLDCARTSGAPAANPIPLAGKMVNVPTKTRDVKPYYPAEAFNRRIQGVVIVEALIAETGCVADARVVRSIPYLDLPALWAVTQWQFTPTTVDDRAVPVLMTVTLNFELR